MKLNVKLSIALVSLVASTFSFASKSFAQFTTPTTGSVTNEKLEVQSGDGSSTTPAAAAAIFSVDAQGNVTGGGVAASVGVSTAGAAVTKSSERSTNGNVAETSAAAALGGDGLYDLNVDAKAGTVNFTRTVDTLQGVTQVGE